MCGRGSLKNDLTGRALFSWRLLTGTTGSGKSPRGTTLSRPANSVPIIHSPEQEVPRGQTRKDGLVVFPPPCPYGVLFRPTVKPIPNRNRVFWLLLSVHVEQLPTIMSDSDDRGPAFQPVNQTELLPTGIIPDFSRSPRLFVLSSLTDARVTS